MDFIIKHKLIVTTIIIQLIALPLILYLVKQEQETRTQAATSTTLYFNPTSTASSPIQATPNQDIALDLMLNPGSNLVTLAKIEITYDPNVFTPAAINPVVVNSQVFKTTIEGPVLSNPGKIQLTIAVGSSHEDIIQTTTKVLTLNMKIKSTTATTKQIGLGAVTEILSIADQDGNDNVLSVATPATVKITIPVTNTPTPPQATPTPSPSPIPTATPTITPSPTRTPSPTPSPSIPPVIPTEEPAAASILNFIGLRLHGLGRGGDNPNPNSIGILNPTRKIRPLTVEFYNAAGSLVNSATGNITYTGETTGLFNGDIVVPASIANGPYTVKIRTPYYKSGNLPGILDLKKGENYNMNLTNVALVAGDANQDNALSVADYEIIMECYSDLLPAKPTCTAAKKLAADIYDDGKVDQKDYNLFMREFSVQRGD